MFDYVTKLRMCACNAGRIVGVNKFEHKLQVSYNSQTKMYMIHATYGIDIYHVPFPDSNNIGSPLVWIS